MTAKGIVLSLVSGVLMGSVFPVVEMGKSSELGLGPDAIGFVFSVGVFLSTFVFNQGNSSGPEGIAFDSKTFAPTCAVWTNQFGPTTLTAYSLARC